MSMQIKAILLYNNAGDVRVIRFRVGEVNIITGESMTGKSTIINIIDYCLGRNTFQIPLGPIQETVAWYAVLFQLDEIEVFIAKPRPDSGQKSQSNVYLELGASIAIPALTQLSLNSTDDAVVDRLSRRLGISRNLNIPEEGQTRDPLEATLRHAKFLLFQPQSVIANEDVLFYRQSETFVEQAIKDTLPYFLGAVQEDQLRLLSELREKRRARRQVQRLLAEAEEATITGVSRGHSLLIEAQQVGLLPDSPLPDTRVEILQLLETTREWEPTTEPPIPDDRLGALQQRQQHLYHEFQERQIHIEAAESFLHHTHSYSDEVSEHVQRLQSIHLYEEEHEESLCPLCLSSLTSPPPGVRQINHSLQRLRAELQGLDREEPDLNDHIQQLKENLEQTRVGIRQNESDIEAVLEEQEAANRIRDTNTRIARVVGRISFYLDITSRYIEDEIDEFRQKIAELEAEIADLQERLDPEWVTEKLASILNLVSQDMTRLSERLRLEHEGPYRLDPKRLTVVADRAITPIVMGQNMGSAANWLGSHLIAMLALHRYFVQQHRPVPNFLVLDQPSQVYFPDDPQGTEEDPEDKWDRMTDEDREAVQSVFGLLFDVCEELHPELQIIVLEHANLDNEAYQRALVEEPWRGGRALIPKEWFGVNSSQTG